MRKVNEKVRVKLVCVLWTALIILGPFGVMCLFALAFARFGRAAAFGVLIALVSTSTIIYTIVNTYKQMLKLFSD